LEKNLSISSALADFLARLLSSAIPFSLSPELPCLQEVVGRQQRGRRSPQTKRPPVLEHWAMRPIRISVLTH